MRRRGHAHERFHRYGRRDVIVRQRRGAITRLGWRFEAFVLKLVQSLKRGEDEGEFALHLIQFFSRELKPGQLCDARDGGSIDRIRHS